MRDHSNPGSRRLSAHGCLIALLCAGCTLIAPMTSDAAEVADLAIATAASTEVAPVYVFGKRLEGVGWVRTGTAHPAIP